MKNYNFNDSVEIYSDEEYSDDSDERIQMSKIKCIDLYLKTQANWSVVIPKCRKNFFRQTFVRLYKWNVF